MEKNANHLVRNALLKFVPAGLFLVVAAPSFAGERPSNKHVVSQPSQNAGGSAPHVDLVIALDTSSSMDGLIDSARAKLWDVVNLLARAKPQPVLRIGLISYGNDGYDMNAGWVKKDADLSTDLDAVYAKLFALKTNGGTEYVARAVHEAIHNMQWDQSDQTLRIVFVAGNEPADQDPKISLASLATDAAAHHVRVNTIYCGSERNAETKAWELLAVNARGGYSSIDQSDVAQIPTPMDSELAHLSTELNDTYVAFGKAAAEKKENQAAQDRNAGSMGAAVAAGRANAKASPLYDAKDWDLVDATKAGGGAAIAAMPAAQLPPAMAHMAPAARAEFVAEKAKQREILQKRIASLSKTRDTYLSAEKAKRAKSGKSGNAAFDDAMNRSIQREAETDLKLHF